MNRVLAKQASRMSAYAYNPPNFVTTVQEGTAKAIVWRVEGMTWIAVEGTRRGSLRDWLKNFWTTPSKFYGIDVHSGCAHEARALLPLLEAQLHPSDVLMFTGHSQGGGVAALLAWAMAERYAVAGGFGIAPMRALTTEACHQFNQFFQRRWWNFALQSDVVPHVPPALRYRRPGIDYFYNEKNRWMLGIPSPFGYLVEVFRLFRQRKLPQMWADHNITKYVDAMTKL